jgi:hypothetical protein
MYSSINNSYNPTINYPLTWLIQQTIQQSINQSIKDRFIIWIWIYNLSICPIGIPSLQQQQQIKTMKRCKV